MKLNRNSLHHLLAISATILVSACNEQEGRDSSGLTGGGITGGGLGTSSNSGGTLSSSSSGETPTNSGEATHGETTSSGLSTSSGMADTSIESSSETTLDTTGGTSASESTTGNADPACSADPKPPLAPCEDHGYNLQPPFDASYTCDVLDFMFPVPLYWGTFASKPDEVDTFVMPGDTEDAYPFDGELYSFPIIRDTGCHLSGFGPSQVVASAPSGYTGTGYSPDGVLFVGRGYQIGQYKGGSTAADKLGVITHPQVPLSYLTMHSFGFVPPGFPGEGRLKVVEFAGRWYDVLYTPDGAGTYDFTAMPYSFQGPQWTRSFVYIKGGSPSFPTDVVLVSSHSVYGGIIAYPLDDAGNPVGTGEAFMTGFGAVGMMFDWKSGDLLMSSGFSPTNHEIIAIHGFTPQPG